MAHNLLKVWPALWTFAERPRVQPTNNHAERALRGSVIYRKLSLGTQSQQGEQRIERLLSAHTTCRLQRRPLHDYLIDALSAHSRGDPAAARLTQPRTERLRRSLCLRRGAGNFVSAFCLRGPIKIDTRGQALLTIGRPPPGRSEGSSASAAARGCDPLAGPRSSVRLVCTRFAGLFL